MIVILGAMDSEISEFLSVLQERQTTVWHGIEEHRGIIDGHPVLISRSGVGKVMAAMRTQHFVDTAAPRAVLFTGLAGGLQSHIAIGDTVLADDLVQHDLDTSELGFPRGHIPYTEIRYLAADPALLALAKAFQPKVGRVHVGRICTGDQFISHRELASHAYLQEELMGAAVEMEGASVALVCTLNQVPFLVARTISDKADGGAAVNYVDFLPQASLNSLDLIQHMLAGMPRH